jgi:hypothetical protein
MTAMPNPEEYSSLSKREQRTCFGLAWFADEAQAETYGKAVAKAGMTVNGGLYDGMRCGRASQFDYTLDGVQLYAVMD